MAVFKDAPPTAEFHALLSAPLLFHKIVDDHASPAVFLSGIEVAQDPLLTALNLSTNVHSEASRR